MPDFAGFDDWVEIFKGGKQVDSSGREHDGDSLVDTAVSRFNAAEHEPPIVVGHPATDAPAYGWVHALRKIAKDGRNVLEAKFTQVHEGFSDMVRDGRFKKRSAAFYPDGSLRHVGWLGAQPPAVKGLGNVAFSDGEAVTFEFSSPSQEERDKMPEKSFMDPEGDKYPIDTPEHVRAASSYWGMPKNREKYPPEKQKAMTSRLNAAKKKFKVGEFADLGEALYMLFRGQKTVMAQDFGAEKAEKVFPETALDAVRFAEKGPDVEPDDDEDDPEGGEKAAGTDPAKDKAGNDEKKENNMEEKEFQEALVQARKEASDEARAAAKAEFAEMQKKVDADRAKEAKTSNIGRFLDQMIQEGKMLPAEREHQAAFMEALSTEKTIQFSEGEATSTMEMHMKSISGRQEHGLFNQMPRRQTPKLSPSAVVLDAAAKKEASGMKRGEAMASAFSENPDSAEEITAAFMEPLYQ